MKPEEGRSQFAVWQASRPEDLWRTKILLALAALHEKKIALARNQLMELVA